MATKENKIVTLPAHIRVRRDTLANWTSINPVLDDGELAIVRMPDGSITMRVGTGADSFKNLPDISNSGADEIHILDSITLEQLNGTLSTSDYELCANNHVIGVKGNNPEDSQVILFYKLAEYSGNYFFSVISEETVVTVTVLASKEYFTEQIVIPSYLVTSGNTVRMNDTQTGVTFDLAKDSSGKIKITLNGAAVGTGITLPGHAVADIEGLQAALDGKANATHTHVHTDITDFDASVDSRIDAKLDALPEVTIPEYTLEKNGEEVSLKKDGAVVGDSIAIASNKGKLLDYDGNEIFNADQSDDVKIILFDCGDSILPTLQAPVLVTQEDFSGYTNVIIKNPNSIFVTLRTSTSTLGTLSANEQSSFRIYGNTDLHFEATNYFNSSILTIEFTSSEQLNVDDLINLSASNDIREGYVGKTIPIKIDGNDVLFRISDVNTYDLSDGSGKSHYTLEMVDVLESRRLNATDTNTGGWAETEAEAYLNSDEALNRIEEKVRNAIQQVKIPYGAIYNQDSLQYVDNKVFYPSYVEVGFTYKPYEPATVEGRIWKYYNDHNNDLTRVKYRDSDSAAVNWWLRSCYKDSIEQFCYVALEGDESHYWANTDFSTSWTFCI